MKKKTTVNLVYAFYLIGKENRSDMLVKANDGFRLKLSFE